MASLFLLISEILRHEDFDFLMTMPTTSSGAVVKSNKSIPASASASASASSESKRVVKFSGDLMDGCKIAELQEDLSRVCVDLVWP
ncbi:hypothetical protein LIER_16843 [Lithospermum erythrorhizon]|uniref:Uncharacterized protein n=1 Tax=Lithospermum erythrorhizon TaxID=34254 RepID=A0AAV3QCJ8_LITER